MDRSDIVDRYAELLLGPAGLDELGAGRDIVLDGAEPDPALAAALRERLHPGALVRPAGRGAFGGILTFKTPDPTQCRPVPAAGRPDARGRWPRKWLVAPLPTADWASLLWPDDDDALHRLWREVAVACRLDEPDPVESWERRRRELAQRAATLTGLALDRLRVTDATTGTDLTIGLLPASLWMSGPLETTAGDAFMPNVPCEEVFTAPDPSRVEGVAVASQPLRLDGVEVSGLRAAFTPGRDALLTADRGEAALGDQLAAPGALRLGEVALVDGESRTARLGTAFKDPLLDENAACHIAFGCPIPGSCGPEPGHGANRSAMHVDVVIGTPATEVTGFTARGEEIPLLSAGVWAKDSPASG